MVDPTSELNEDISPEDAPVCETCDAALVDTPDQRVVTWIADGAVRTVHFCDEACRSEWSLPGGQ